jgi:hypothetical protein
MGYLQILEPKWRADMLLLLLLLLFVVDPLLLAL